MTTLNQLQSFETSSKRMGRTTNRRVDIAIFANDKLKDAAKKQTEG